MSKALVEAVKAGLIQRGLYHPETGNDAALQITGRVIWALRDKGAKFVIKRPEQNGADLPGVFIEGKPVKVSHDAIAFPDMATGDYIDSDEWKDCLESAGPPLNINRPLWNHTNSSTARLIDPINFDAQQPPAPGPTPPQPFPIDTVPKVPYTDEFEEFMRDRVGPAFEEEYRKRGRPLNGGFFTWPGRIMHDIYMEGMAREASFQKHLAKCIQVLDGR